MPPTHIAVLGGGLSGLSSAFHLSRKYPSALITLLEKSSRLGGWVHSERVPVVAEAGRTGSVLLEAGPRTLRPNSKAVLELIHLLELESSVITTPRSAPAARNRFLYLPPSESVDGPKPPLSGLIKIPISLGGLFTSPLARVVLLPAVLREPFTASTRPSSPSIGSGADPTGSGATAAEADDESFDAFCTHHFGPAFARTFGSALVHGIYAADSRQLSVRAAFPSLWDARHLGGGSVVRGFAKRMIGLGTGKALSGPMPYELGTVREKMKDASVFSFRDGIAELTAGMEWALEKRNNVRVFKEAEVLSVDLDHQEQVFKLDFKENTPSLPPISHLVSALPLPHLASLLPPSTPLPHLRANPSSSVTIVNFIFPPMSEPLHPAGFGYLVPRPADGYGAHHEGILGTVFDSCALAAQDTCSHAGEGFTKLTMMLGGPHPISNSHVGYQTLLRRLAEHLGRRTPLPEPIHTRVIRHADCIPTLTPGHLRRMDELRAVLKKDASEGGFAGRMEVIGAGVGGVSVGDCVEQGRNVGSGWA